MITIGFLAPPWHCARFPAAVARLYTYHVENARGEAGLLYQAEYLMQRAGHLFGWFNYISIAAGNGIRQKPEGHHAREIERCDDGAYPDGLPDHDLVYSPCYILGVVALHHLRYAAGNLHVLDQAARFTMRLFQGFAALHCYGTRQVLETLLKQVLQLEQVLHTLCCRGPSPGRESRGGGIYCTVDFFDRRKTDLSQDLGGSRVYHVLYLVGFRRAPFAAYVIQNFILATHLK
jgi:hypothetical protein